MLKGMKKLNKIIKAVFRWLLSCFILFIAIVIFYFLNIKKTDEVSKLAETIILYCKQKGIYNSKIDYEGICSVVITNSLYFNLDPKLVVAHIICESEFNQNVINSNKNGTFDYGLMQINTVWDGHFFKEEAFHNIMFKPEYNIYAGCYIISENIKFAKGDLYKAIQRYNGSGAKAEEYARKIINTYYEICKGNGKEQNGGMFVWKK